MARPQAETSRTEKPARREECNGVGDLQTVMRLIDDRLDEIFKSVPARHRPLIPNALLNLAVEYMLAEEAPEAAATILHRLAALIAQGKRPSGSDAFPLTGHDA